MKREASQNQFWDKLEFNLIISSSKGGSFNRFNPLMFPSVCTPITQKVSLSIVLRRTGWWFLLLLTYYAFFFALIVNGFVVALVITFRHHIHHIHHITWRLIRVLYRVATREALDFLSDHGTLSTREIVIEHALTIIGFSLLGFGFFLTLRWAWNRRAERLNREGNVPEPAVVGVPGVWPPPPNSQR